MHVHQVYLSLGGNEGDALSRLKQALSLIEGNKQSVSQLHYSHFYWTKPINVETSCWFVNAACTFLTNLSISDVFQMTERIERELGKKEKPKNADRPIDIDLLFYGTKVCKEGNLEIPHPCWKERLFVLMPLADLTTMISLKKETGIIQFHLNELIQLLLLQSHQTVSLLEKNPHLQ